MNIPKKPAKPGWFGGFLSLASPVYFDIRRILPSYNLPDIPGTKGAHYRHDYRTEQGGPKAGDRKAVDK